MASKAKKWVGRAMTTVVTLGILGGMGYGAYKFPQVLPKQIANMIRPVEVTTALVQLAPVSEAVYGTGTVEPERWAKDALFAPEAREKYRELVAQGWTDAIRALHPDERIYTFWHYWRNSFARDAGIRIDHALLSPSLAKKLRAVGVDREPRGWDKTSDHAPMWVEVEV